MDLLLTVMSLTRGNTPLITAYVAALRTCPDINILHHINERWNKLMADCKEQSMCDAVKNIISQRLDGSKAPLALYTQAGYGGYPGAQAGSGGYPGAQAGYGGYPGHAKNAQVAMGGHHAQAALGSYIGNATHAPMPFTHNAGHAAHAQRFIAGHAGFGQPAYPTQPFEGQGFAQPQEDSVESLKRRLAVAEENDERKLRLTVSAENNQQHQLSETRHAMTQDMIATIQTELLLIKGQATENADDLATLKTRTTAVEKTSDKTILGLSETNARVDQQDVRAAQNAKAAAEAAAQTHAMLAKMMADFNSGREADRLAAEKARPAPTNAKPLTAAQKKKIDAAKAVLAKHDAEVAAEAVAEAAQESEDDDCGKEDVEAVFDMNTAKATPAKGGKKQG
jgi:hypothetical protein